MLRTYFIILALVIGTTGCNNQTEADTLNLQIGIPQILAFSMTQYEYDNLSETEAGDYDEGYADLKFYLSRFAGTVGDTDILIRETASRYIRIGDSLIDRKILKSDFGLIFISKTGEYEIVNHGLLDSEIALKAKKMKLISP